MMAPDGSVRDIEVVADTHGAAKIQLKSDVGSNERLLFIRVVQE